MQKPKQKRKTVTEPQAEEDFGVEECYCKLEETLVFLILGNESLIDDICYATDRIEQLEDKLKTELSKGFISGGIFVGIIWLISLLK
jgi:hypothetical protein